jgi:hypothetical protein
MESWGKAQPEIAEAQSLTPPQVAHGFPKGAMGSCNASTSLLPAQLVLSIVAVPPKRLPFDFGFVVNANVDGKLGKGTTRDR